MKARPIVFTGPMVRALLEGRKTQTRQIVNPQPRHAQSGWTTLQYFGNGIAIECGPDYPDDTSDQRASPYGQPGDLLYVSEAWYTTTHIYDSPRLNIFGHDRIVLYEASPAMSGINTDQYKRASVMPRPFSRITLRLSDVCVERVQEISEDDAEAEGAHPPFTTDTGAVIPQPYYRYGFRELWNDTNGAGAWDRNDWVWVYTFDVIHANVDDVLAEPSRYGIPERSVSHA